MACVQLLTVLSTALLVGWATRKFLPAAAKPVYLIDTYTYKPPDRCGCCSAALGRAWCALPEIALGSRNICLPQLQRGSVIQS